MPSDVGSAMIAGALTVVGIGVVTCAATPIMSSWSPVYIGTLMADREPATVATVEVQRNDVPITTYLEAWDWRCTECGHVSRGHVSEKAARKDHKRHVCPLF